MKRLFVIAALFLAPLAYGQCSDCGASAGYVTITVAATQVDEPVPFASVDVSALPAGFHAALDGIADTTGASIRATNADGSTELPIHVVNIDTATDSGRIHFLGTGMSASVNVDYRLYAGNPDASMYATSATYGRDNVYTAYVSAFTLSGSSPWENVTGGPDLTPINAPTTGQSGFVNGMQSVLFDDASSEYASGAISITWPVVIEGWFRFDSFAAAQVPFGITNDNSFSSYLRGYLNTNPRWTALAQGNSGSSSTAQYSAILSQNTWYYGIVMRDNANELTVARIAGSGFSDEDATALNSPIFDTIAAGASVRASVAQYFSGNVSWFAARQSVPSSNYWSTSYNMWTNSGFVVEGAWTAHSTGPSGHPWFYQRR